MRPRVLLLVLPVLAISCQSESFERFVVKEDGISFRLLSGWEHRRERATSVFVAGGPEIEGTTIAVRSVAIRESERRWRGADAIAAASRTLLESLPGAEVKGPVPAAHRRFEATSFALSFTSRDSGERYERRHVVLLSRSGGRVVHLFHTAPSGKLGLTAKVFDEVVASVKEEV